MEENHREEVLPNSVRTFNAYHRARTHYHKVKSLGELMKYNHIFLVGGTHEYCNTSNESHQNERDLEIIQV